MRIRQTNLGLFFYICATLVCFQNLAQPTLADDLTRILPAETPVYLKIKEPGSLLLDDFRNPYVWDALRKIPNLGDQLEGPQLEQVKAVLGALAATEDLSWSELLRGIMQGPAEVVYSPKGNRLFLSVIPKDIDQLERVHGKLLEFARQDAKSKGNPDPVKEFEHAGVKCFSFSESEAHAIYQGRILVVSSQQILRDALDHLTGAKSSESVLANEPLFVSAVQAAQPDSHAAFGFVRYDVLRRSGGYFKPLEEYNPLMALLFGGWVEAYNKADWLALNLDVKSGKPALEAILPVSEETAKGEIRQMFTPPAGQSAPARLEISNQLGSLELWRDLGKVWNIREEVVKGPSIQGLNGLDNGIGQFFGGRDFGTGVLGSLNSDWRLIVSEQDSAKLNPKPDLLLPQFAVTVGFDAKDEDFRQRWIIAFQSLVGVLNVVGAQQKAPALVQNQEMVENAMVYSARFLPPAEPKADNDQQAQGVHIRHNFRPTLAFLNDHIIIATTAELAKEVIKALQKPQGEVAEKSSHSMNMNLDGDRIANLVDLNRERLVMQNMVEKGHGRKAAETEIGGLESLIRTLNRASVTVDDCQNLFRIRVGFDLNRSTN